MATMMTIVIKAIMDSLDHDGLALGTGMIYDEPVKVSTSILICQLGISEDPYEVDIPFVATIVSLVFNI
jgi:hypothetical protein